MEETSHRFPWTAETCIVTCNPTSFFATCPTKRFIWENFNRGKTHLNACLCYKPKGVNVISLIKKLAIILAD